MSLRTVGMHLRDRKEATATQLAAACGVPPGTIDAALALLIERGRVVAEDLRPPDHCGTTCGGCALKKVCEVGSLVPKTGNLRVYRWKGEAGA